MGINKMNNLKRLQKATRDHLQGRVLKNSLEELGSSVVNAEKEHAELLEEQRQHPPRSYASIFHPNITQFPTGYHNPRTTDPFWRANARSRSQNRVRAAIQEERNQINMKEQEGSLPDGFNSFRQRKGESNQQQQLGRVFNQKLSRKEKN